MIFSILFAASFTQSLAGFGLGLVGMPLLAAFVGVRMGAPLLALVGPLVQIVLIARYRAALNLQSITRLGMAAALGIPVGVIALRRLDADLLTTILGIVIAGYALYALVAPRLPRLTHPAWAYAFGLVAGLLGGAYTVGAPPLIVYGDINRWEPAEFKVNLQSIFTIIVSLQIISHAVSGNFTLPVWQALIGALPGTALGIAAGLSLDGRIDPALFRKIVLVLLVVVGIGLIV